VVTNDPQRAQFILTLRFSIEAGALPPGRRVGWFVVSPTDQLRGQVKQGSSFATSATVYTTGERRVRFTKLVTKGDAFAAKLETVEEGKHYVVAARSSPLLPPGQHRQTVKLLTDSEDYPDLEIDLQVTVVEDSEKKPGKP
jgi:hypothetical protein